jgi:hypothetical protein
MWLITFQEALRHSQATYVNLSLRTYMENSSLAFAQTKNVLTADYKFLTIADNHREMPLITH